MSQTFTTEFAKEYDAAQAERLRGRFLAYTRVLIVMGFVMLGLSVVAMVVPGKVPRHGASFGLSVVVGLLSQGAYIWAHTHVRRGRHTRQELLEIAYWLLVGGGLATLVVAAFAGIDAAARETGSGGPLDRQAALIASLGFMLISVAVSQFVACCFLPWTARESLRPLMPQAIALAGVMVFFVWTAPLVVLGAVLLAPVLTLPGTAVCWWRHSRFKDEFLLSVLRGRYGEIKRELTDARRLHEALFPRADARGSIRFEYRYEPARQIGGDFVYARFHHDEGDSEPTLSIVLLDVTGHGVAAALTVNRLYGEIERLFAENPDLGPGECLRALNRYVHLTLATHEIFVTGVCVRIDPARDMLHYAAAGHPPAFLRAVHGTIEDLQPTAMMLGVVPDSEFDPAPRPCRFGPGDALVAYTDGAMETRDPSGRQLGIVGLQRAIASGGGVGPGQWPGLLLTAVERHRQAGPISDDTLIVEVSRLVAPMPAAPMARRTAPATASVTGSASAVARGVA